MTILTRIYIVGKCEDAQNNLILVHLSFLLSGLESDKVECDGEKWNDQSSISTILFTFPTHRNESSTVLQLSSHSCSGEK